MDSSKPAAGRADRVHDWFAQTFDPNIGVETYAICAK